MSAAKILFAVTFVLFLSFTIVVPSFPPAQIMFEYVRIPQTTLYIWGISIATLLNGIINGFFWLLVVTITYGLAQLAAHTGKSRLLPPMPLAPRLETPPLEPMLVDDRVNKIPPAFSVPSASVMQLIESSIEVPIVSKIEIPSTKVRTAPVEAYLDIETIEGIGPIHREVLRNAGVFTVGDLLRVGGTERGRRQLANEVGVSNSTILRWVYRGDLLRVKGIGGKYSALLESAGVNTVRDLSMKNPHHLYQTLEAVNRERTPVKRVPPSKTIGIWVRRAKNLESIIVE
jgi:predicted flap endonuclease-1-like 5' DNA nuclease